MLPVRNVGGQERYTLWASELSAFHHSSSRFSGTGEGAGAQVGRAEVGGQPSISDSGFLGSVVAWGKVAGELAAILRLAQTLSLQMPRMTGLFGPTSLQNNRPKHMIP